MFTDQLTMQFQKTFSLSLLAFVLLAVPPPSFSAPNEQASSTKKTKPPHIIVIVADDLGWNDVGYHGSDIRTPAIDSLARAGVRLERFYALPVCTPSRYALLTGKYPMRGGFQVGAIKPWADWGLPQEEHTLPELLREAGYFTAIVGKWHLGHRRAEFLPLSQGFDAQYGPYNGMIDYFTHKRNGARDWHRNQEPLAEQGYATELFAREAVRLITNHDAARPFFLYLPFTAPHTPLQAPRRSFGIKYQHIKDKKRWPYAAMTESLDEAVGSVVEALKNRKMFSDTLLIFLSDNGGNLVGGGNNSPLRGEKGTLYDGGIRVPALAVWPRRIPAGGLVSAPMHIVDLYPTLASAAGAQLKQQGSLDGIDAWDLLLGKETAPDRRILLQIEPQRGALLDGQWKLVASSLHQASPKVELFDLAADPREQVDLSSSHPQLTARLLSVLNEYSSQAMPPKLKPKPPGWRPPAIW